MCRFLVVFLWLAVLPNAYAKDAGDLYRAQTIVTGTEEPEGTRGFRSGLIDALIKQTGDARLADDPALKPVLAHPHALISHFDYEDRMKDIPVHDEQGTLERPHFLRMQFQPGKTDEILRDLGLSKWGPDRPTVAVWMGVKNAVGAFVLTSDGDEGYGQRAVLV